MSVCKGCGEQIEWRKNDKTGASAPVDPKPVPEGNVTLVGAEEYHVLLKAEKHALVEPGFFDGEPPTRYVLHFASHPDCAVVYRRRDKTAHRAPRGKHGRRY